MQINTLCLEEFVLKKLLDVHNTQLLDLAKAVTLSSILLMDTVFQKVLMIKLVNILGFKFLLENAEFLDVKLLLNMAASDVNLDSDFFLMEVANKELLKDVIDMLLMDSVKLARDLSILNLLVSVYLWAAPKLTIKENAKNAIQVEDSK